MAEQQERQDESEEVLHWSDLRSFGCALVLLLLVVGGAIGGAKGGASLVDGGVFVYVLGTIGAIVGAVLVGLVVLFIWSDLRSFGCALVLLLLVVGGAIGGAKGGASLVDGGVFVYILGTIGGIVGAVLVGLVVLFIVFPILVMGSYEDARSESVKRLQKEVRLEPDDMRGLLALGDALETVGRSAEARDAFEKAIRLRTDDPRLYVKLGDALDGIGRPDEAIGAYQEAVRLSKEIPEAHFKLGLALRKAGRLDDAIAAFREVLRLQNDDPNACNNLGFALRDTGRFAEAIAALRDAKRIFEARCSPRTNSDPHRAALRETELMARAADRLPAVLEGKDRLGDAAECLVYAQLCQLPYLKKYAAAARFFDEAFARQPHLAEDLQERHRYSAASVAARAGCGQGGDTAGLEEKERARLRRQSRAWLRADLSAWDRRLDNGPDKTFAANMVNLAMQRWLGDPDLAGVRGPEALAKLPEAEQRPWQELWDHVTATRRRGQETLGQLVRR